MLKDTPKRDALEFLRDSSTMVIATCDSGRPHAATVYYGFDEDFNFYYLTKEATRKAAAVTKNPKAALVIGTGPERITIQASGTMVELKGTDKDRAFNIMTARFSHHGIDSLPAQMMKRLATQKFVAFKIIPEELSFMNMDSDRYPESKSSSFHKIIG